MAISSGSNRLRLHRNALGVDVASGFYIGIQVAFWRISDARLY
ncbi:predicted protein [Sclerotinia sclerotiorum 1980 UF-70]|uniref:Uncharacterized protein n=1 Tax=Sclerotinia sclerotiorum (strain ATCC 18683 / 1980 / Ss-1) TaxID=665079 RepID=A7F9C2_SCLS1|nr:predicted protein [Sclerotinia sclerotiorum 1980 UF-70]EDO00333.1 predicted protein [Sclerotinia sclerotiorum 1980 UF-70]